MEHSPSESGFPTIITPAKWFGHHHFAESTAAQSVGYLSVGCNGPPDAIYLP